MKTPLVILLLILIGFTTRADVVTASTEGSRVAFTNSQSNFAWSPSAVIFTRDYADTVSLSIYRHGQGLSVLLATISATASNLIWVPGNRYIFNTGSSLELISSVTNFSIQLHREPVHE